jgi:ABC-type phosphate/phosphonate transport system ATPase subunit
MGKKKSYKVVILGGSSVGKLSLLKASSELYDAKQSNEKSKRTNIIKSRKNNN